MNGLLEKFSDLPASVEDANLLLMAGHLPGAVIWTTDRDFFGVSVAGKKASTVILPEW